MKKSFILAAVAAVVSVSCQKEIADINSSSSVPAGPLAISAATPSFVTKTYLSTETPPLTRWNESDKLSVFNENNKLGGVMNTSRVDKTVADFVCDSWAGGIPTMAVFAMTTSANAQAVSYSGGKYKVTVLNEQRGNNPNSFGAYSSTAIGQITGNATDGYSVAMKNVLGLVRVEFTSLINTTDKVSTMESITLEDAKGEAEIAGDILVDYNGGEPVCEPVEGAGEKVITRANTNKGTALKVASKGIAYFCVIPGVSFTPKFTFKDLNGSKAVVIANSPISAVRSEYVPCGEPVIKWGKQRETAVFDFSSWCMKEALVKTANTTTTYTLGTETEYLSGKAKIIVTSSSNEMVTDVVNYGLAFKKPSDDTRPTIEILPMEGYKIAKVSISTSQANASSTYVLKDKAGNQIASKKIRYNNVSLPDTMTVDVEAYDATNFTTGGDGCVFTLADKLQYQVSRIVVTYSKDLE